MVFLLYLIFTVPLINLTVTGATVAPSVVVAVVTITVIASTVVSYLLSCPIASTFRFLLIYFPAPEFPLLWEHQFSITIIATFAPAVVPFSATVVPVALTLATAPDVAVLVSVPVELARITPNHLRFF